MCNCQSPDTRSTDAYGDTLSSEEMGSVLEESFVFFASVAHLSLTLIVRAVYDPSHTDWGVIVTIWAVDPAVAVAVSFFIDFPVNCVRFCWSKTGGKSGRFLCPVVRPDHSQRPALELPPSASSGGFAA